MMVLLLPLPVSEGSVLCLAVRKALVIRLSINLWAKPFPCTLFYPFLVFDVSTFCHHHCMIY